MIESVRNFKLLDGETFKSSHTGLSPELNLTLAHVCSYILLVGTISDSHKLLKDIDKKAGETRFPVAKLKEVFFLVLKDLLANHSRDGGSIVQKLNRIHKVLEGRGLTFPEIASDEGVDNFERVCSRYKKNLLIAGFAHIQYSTTPLNCAVLPMPNDIDSTLSVSYTRQVEKLKKLWLLNTDTSLYAIDLDSNLENWRIEKGYTTRSAGKPRRLVANKVGGFYGTRIVVPPMKQVVQWAQDHTR